MNKTDIILGLTELANDLGIKIRKEKGIYTEGICTVNDTKYILLNKNSPTDRIIFIIAKALVEIGIEDLYIKPYLREIIESHIQSRAFYFKGDKVE